MADPIQVCGSCGCNCLSKRNVFILIVIGSILFLISLPFGYVDVLTRKLKGVMKNDVQEIASLASSQTLQNRSKCVSGEKYEAIKSCEPCTEYEKKITLKVCSITGNKQLVRCQKSKLQEYISCKFVESKEFKKFWIFEGSFLAGGVVSNLLVWWRRRQLDYISYQRLKRQMSDGIV